MTSLRLKSNWRLIVRKAWSVKFMALAFVFTAVEVALPFFDGGMPKGLFALLSALATAGALITRLLAQKEVNGD